MADGLLTLIKKAAREAAERKYQTMTIGDVVAACEDEAVALDVAIEACVDFGLDYDLHEDLCDVWTDAFCAELEQIAADPVRGVGVRR